MNYTTFSPSQKTPLFPHVFPLFAPQKTPFFRPPRRPFMTGCTPIQKVVFSYKKDGDFYGRKQRGVRVKKGVPSPLPRKHATGTNLIRPLR